MRRAELLVVDYESQSVIFVKIDVDKGSAVAQKNNVSSLPTFKLFQQGKVVDEQVGWSESRLKTLIDKHLTASSSSMPRKDK
jgi:thioredoxin-like negative regulator of GroEL